MIKKLILAAALLSIASIASLAVEADLSSWTSRKVFVTIDGGAFAWTNSYQGFYVTQVEIASATLAVTNGTQTGIVKRVSAPSAGSATNTFASVAISGAQNSNQGYGMAVTRAWTFNADVLSSTNCGASNGVAIITGQTQP